MRLLTKYNRVSIVVTIIALFASGLCYYGIIRYILINQLDKDLRVEEEEVTDYIRSNHALPNPSNYKDQQVIFTPLNGAKAERSISSIDVYDQEEHETDQTRQLIFPVNVEGKYYKVSILKSQEETEDLIKLILLITLGIVVLLLLTLFLINRFLLNKLWQPFNTTLKELNKFNLSNKKNIQLQETSITEFAELNKAVKIMTERVTLDYNSLKTFTENASHEMQTPLAIINSKLDNMLQDESMNSGQMQHLQGIYDAVGRLSRLTQSLLLLTKIENNQFTEKQIVRLDILLFEKITQLEELTHSKKLTIARNLNETAVRANKHLLDILFNNLLMNAIRYNKEGGTIIITLKNNELNITNTSCLPALDKENIFKRFYRHRDNKDEGNGLGLSIIKQICDIAGYELDYSYHNNAHQFSIQFNGAG